MPLISRTLTSVICCNLSAMGGGCASYSTCYEARFTKYKQIHEEGLITIYQVVSNKGLTRVYLVVSI